MQRYGSGSCGVVVGPSRVLVFALAATVLAGCNRPTARIEQGSSGLSSFVELMMPSRLTVEGFTKAVSFNEKRTADGLEVVLRALDAAGDPIKVVGTFNIELYRQAADPQARVGQRLSSWTVSTADPKSFVEHWERFGRFYRFNLQLDTNDLPAGPYVVHAWVDLPNNTRLFADHAFTHPGSPVPAALAIR